jgi:hypothetical protein
MFKNTSYPVGTPSTILFLDCMSFQIGIIWEVGDEHETYDVLGNVKCAAEHVKLQ